MLNLCTAYVHVCMCVYVSINLFGINRKWWNGCKFLNENTYLKKYWHNTNFLMCNSSLNSPVICSLSSLCLNNSLSLSLCVRVIFLTEYLPWSCLYYYYYVHLSYTPYVNSLCVSLTLWILTVYMSMCPPTSQPSFILPALII